MIRRIVLSRWSLVAVLAAAVSVAHLWPFGRLGLTPSVSLVELEWSLTALLGAGYSADFIRDCILDWREAEIDDEGTQQAIDVFLLIGFLFLGLHLMLLGFGVLAMLARSSPSSNAYLARVLGVGFTVAGQELVLALIVIRAKRARMRELASVRPSEAPLAL